MFLDFVIQKNTQNHPMPLPPAPQSTDISAQVFEVDQADLYGQYILSNPLDILFVLRSMLKRSCVVTAYINQGEAFFLTKLVHIDTDECRVLLDAGNEETINRDALRATRLVVCAMLDHIKIQFVLTGIRETSFEGTPAFAGSIPSTLLRLQRREYFRLETPKTEPPRCQIPIPAHNAPVHNLDVTLLDISGGGLCLMAPPSMESYLKPGALFPNCRLEIPDLGVMAVTLRVRSLVGMASIGGQEYLRAGCEFVSLPGTRLTMIQRYITRIERERKAREAGLD